MLSNETNHLTIAQALSDKLITTMDQEYGGMGDKLRHYRDQAWNGKAPNVTALLDDVAVEQRATLLTGITRLGQLYDLASLVARDNALNGSSAPKLDEYENLEDAIAHLNKPVFEVTMTAHPTNVNDIDSIKVLREMGKLLHEDPDNERLDGLIEDWVEMPLIPTQKDENGNDIPGVLNIADETEMTVSYTHLTLPTNREV